MNSFATRWVHWPEGRRTNDPLANQLLCYRYFDEGCLGRGRWDHVVESGCVPYCDVHAEELGAPVLSDPTWFPKEWTGQDDNMGTCLDCFLPISLHPLGRFNKSTVGYCMAAMWRAQSHD